MTTRPVRVRFAPSPTGSLHVGGARTALFNWLYARQARGTFVLRIEDTDRQRSTTEYHQGILRDMQWLGLDWDEGPGAGGSHGPYTQMERLPLYKEYADRLLAGGRAYPCFCTAEELAAAREQAARAGRRPGYPGTCRTLTPARRAQLEAEGRRWALRFRVDPGSTVVEDQVRGRVVFDHAELDDFIIVKTGGIPVYNFAVVIDDALMEMTLVMRGEEHLSNTPRQILIFEALGLPLPEFAHIPLILNEDKTKLSKRKGSSTVDDFRVRGFLPQAMMNFLALLGWSPGQNREILSLEEMVEAFRLQSVQAHPAVFDEKKLEWMNGQYIKAMGPADLVRTVTAFYDELAAREQPSPEAVAAARALHEADPARLEGIAALLGDRLRTLADWSRDAGYFAPGSVAYDADAEAKFFKDPEVPTLLQGLAAALRDLPAYTVPAIEEAVRALAQTRGMAAAKIIHPARVAVTGRRVSPGLFEVMAVLGRDVTLARLEEAIAFLESRGAAAAFPPGITPAPAQVKH